MRYLVCDNDGQLHERTGTGDWLADLDREVGPEGWASVRIRHGQLVGLVAGFVNDCGLIAPEKYPRNVVGSCLLAALGANVQPYAGPVVITGWDESDPEGLEVVGLADVLAAMIRQAHADVRIALGLDPGPSSPAARAAWLDEMVQVAEYVRVSETPPIQVLTDPAEIFAHLRGGR